MAKYTYNIYHLNHSSKLKFLLFIYYFWLPWVFITAVGLSLGVASGVPSVAAHARLIVVASLVAELRLQARGLQ